VAELKLPAGRIFGAVDLANDAAGLDGVRVHLPNLARLGEFGKSCQLSCQNNPLSDQTKQHQTTSPTEITITTPE
jgi:hypothetical protein